MFWTPSVIKQSSVSVSINVTSTPKNTRFLIQLEVLESRKLKTPEQVPRL